MDTSTLQGMLTWIGYWRPLWSQGQSLGVLRLAVENARGYHLHWTSMESAERLEALLIQAVRWGAFPDTATMRTARGAVPYQGF